MERRGGEERRESRDSLLITTNLKVHTRIHNSGHSVAVSAQCLFCDLQHMAHGSHTMP